MRIAIVASHPIQYQAPIFRRLAQQADLTVYIAHQVTATEHANAGFGVGFQWDIDLLSGYRHHFMRNVAARPGVNHFVGCDTPEISDHIASGGFDGVVTMGWHLKTFIQAALAARRNRIPVLTRADSQLGTPRSLLKKAIKELTYPAFLRLFDGALYVGALSRAYWEHYHFPASRMFFSPHCIDTEWFAARATDDARKELRQKLGIADSTHAVLFAGKLMPLKRPLDIVAALGHLKRQGIDVAMVVAGAGELEQEVAGAARAAAVPLHLLGFCNQSEMPAVYAATDVLVLSSNQETWGLVANEALACGRPIVLSDAVGSAPDLAADGTVGRVFARGDAVDLSRALKELFDRPPSRDAIAAKSAAYSVDAASLGILTGIKVLSEAKLR